VLAWGALGMASVVVATVVSAFAPVEIAPASLLASHVTGGTVDRTRPLCPYPAFAVYKGQGSIDQADSFDCQEPRQVPNYFVIG
jgi:feruloyl esterase